MALMDLPQPPAVELDPAMRQLVSAVGAVLDSPCVELPAAQSLGRLQALMVLGGQVTALQAEAVRDCGSRELFALDGAGSTGGWLRQQSAQVLPGAAPGAVDKWGRLPQVAQAVRDGALAPRSAEVLARAVTSLPDDEALLQPGAVDSVLRDGVLMVLAAARGGEPLPDDAQGLLGWKELRRRLEEIADSGSGVHARLESAFLLVAEQLPPGQLHGALAQLADAVRPEELERDEQSAHDKRSASVVRNPGGHGWRLTAELDDEAGELASKLFAAFDRVERDPGRGLLGDSGRGLGPDSGAGGGGLVRSRAQRRHDALSAAMRCALESGEVPADGGVRPHITVTVTADRLDDVAGALPAMTDSGCRITRDTLQRWLCDSDVALALLADKTGAVRGMGAGGAVGGSGGAGAPAGVGHVLDVARTVRTATRKQRTALRVMWDGCAVHGCGRGWKHLTPHHVVPWSLGGATDLSNLVPLCDGCHHDVHEDRRHLRLSDQRWIGPEGWVTGPPV
jgi:hypothetical protein